MWARSAPLGLVGVGLISAEVNAGCPAEFLLLGCYAVLDSNRTMPKKILHEPMSAEICYMLCDDGLNTHFGTLSSRECRCGINPELNIDGGKIEPIECDHHCAGGDECGESHNMVVFEITAYQGCPPEAKALDDPDSSQDEQKTGEPWDYQKKFDTTNFFKFTEDSSFSWVDEEPAEECDINDDHKKLLAQVDVAALTLIMLLFCVAALWARSAAYAPLCDAGLQAIKETWARHCDGFVAFSDVADDAILSFKIKHEGPEEYSNMWQKSRAIWKYINFHYKDDFDWFVLGGDDLFLIVENLRKYLLSDEIIRAAGGLQNGGTNPMFLGRRLQRFGEQHRIYNNGGASYVMNQASVGLLGNHLDDSRCQPHTKQSWEDVLVSRCLKVNGVMAFDTRDDLGRERFHPFSPAVHIGYQMPETPEDRLVSGFLVGGWYGIQAIELKFGLECCSQDSISFHYIDEQLMRRLYHLVYSCPEEEGMIGPR
ncbi:unnamed protein product [Ectocarpus sp. 8 AP-2014]